MPPHEWNVDFPHLALRAKAVKYQKGQVRARDKLLTSKDLVGSPAGLPVVNSVVKATLNISGGRGVLQTVLQIDRTARVPASHRDTLRKRHPH